MNLLDLVRKADSAEADLDFFGRASGCWSKR
jgi:hypothetical protein